MMASYFNTSHGGGGGGSGGNSEIQAAADHTLQTLHLMNPSYSTNYTSDTNNIHHHHHPEPPPPTHNMLLLNPGNLPQPPTFSAYNHQQQQQHFLGIPLTGNTAAGPSNSNPADHDPTRSLHNHHQISNSNFQNLVPRLHDQYNHHWNTSSSSSMDPNTTLAAGSHHVHIPTAVAVSAAAGSGAAELGFRRPAAVVAAALQQQQQQQQGLSLSLSPHEQNNSISGNQNQVTMVSGGGGGDDDMIMRMCRGSSTTTSNMFSNGTATTGGVVHQSVILGSKYLKAAQQLLDEVVNVGDAMNNNRINNNKDEKTAAKGMETVAGEGRTSTGTVNCGENINGMRATAHELTTVQRQELQMKKAKLLNMVEEVEQRYRQYHNQMQMVISPFEQAAGLDSAKSYTSLALQTISKQFRCLKDAITTQIKVTSKTLGEEYHDHGIISGGKLEAAAGNIGTTSSSSSSRLKFVDHQIRQQRALQQLGMIQHNAWRPQRGLPERAVSVLRAWLFEHFLHPYPKDSDKHVLAKQTGLKRSQVSNWFINARVRLWKPMVEEMYVEEMKSQEQNTNNGNCDHQDNQNNMIGSTSTTPHDQHNSNKDMVPSTLDHNSTTSSSGIMTRIEPQHVHVTGGGTNSPSNLHQQNLRPHHHHPTNNNMGISNNSPATGLHTVHQGFTLIGSPDIDPRMDPRSPKKQRCMDMQNSPSSILSMEMEMKPTVGNDHHHHGNRDHLGVLKYAAAAAAAGGQHHDQTQSFMNNNNDHGFGAYQIGDHLGRFDVPGGDQLAQRFHGNGVSLTLGLPPNEPNLPFHGTHQQQNFMSGHESMQLGRRLDMGGAGEADFVGISSAPQPTHTSSGAYDHNMEIQNRKRFAAQLLPDFVV